MKKSIITDEEYWYRFREEVRPILEEIVEKTRPAWVDSMLSAGDKAAGYFKKFDEEKTVLAGRVDDIDERVQRIEEKFGFPT